MPPPRHRDTPPAMLHRPDADPRRRPLARRRAQVALALALACAASSAGARAATDIPLEYAVKATYLYKLAPFVEWPPGTFASHSAPFRICVAGPAAFSAFLQRAVAGHGLGEHQFEVQLVGGELPASRCQILFLAAPRATAVPQMLEAVEGQPVLTVADSTLPRDTGIVQFVMVHGRVRFDIDTRAASRNHLQISSKLLDLALTVRGGP